MTWTIISYLIWSIYISIEGFREANFKHLKRKMPKIEMKVPKLCNIQRILVLSLLSYFLFTKVGLWFIGIIIPMLLLTLFIHNGTYFYLRNKLNPNICDKGFCSDAIDKEETPSLYLKFKYRKYLAITGFILQIIICFLR